MRVGLMAVALALLAGCGQGGSEPVVAPVVVTTVPVTTTSTVLPTTTTSVCAEVQAAGASQLASFERVWSVPAPTVPDPSPSLFTSLSEAAAMANAIDAVGNDQQERLVALTAYVRVLGALADQHPECFTIADRAKITALVQSLP